MPKLQWHCVLQSRTKLHWQRAAAYVVLVDNLDCILLTKLELQGHGMTGSWTLPGGGMEWGEQAIDTATRELFEETGLSADIGPLIGTTSEWIEAENMSVVRVFRHAEAFSVQLDNMNKKFFAGRSIM